MKISLIAIGNRMPDWVNTAYQDFAKRLPKDYALQLCELPAEKRRKNQAIDPLLDEEARRLFEAVPKNDLVIALDREGQMFDTQAYSTKLSNWHDSSQNISILIGGPEGIPKSHLKLAHETWSLSQLTMAHPFVRVLMAEQTYRAWSMISGRSYHR